MLKRASPGIKDKTESTLNQESTGVDVRILVFSKHLILAWPVFEAMLQNYFSKEQTLPSNCSLELPLLDDDPDAFPILLNIIHRHSRKVPRTIDMHLAAGITILVDKYQVQEVVEVYSALWIKHFEPDVPQNMRDNLIDWLCIFWVFEYADQFKRTT